MGLRAPAGLLHDVVGDTVLGMVENVAERGQGRDQEGAAPDHLFAALLVHEDAVLDGGDPAPGRVEDPLRSLRMARGGPVKADRLRDAGRHLVRGIVGVLGIDPRGHHPARRHDLDEVRARVDLLANRLDHLVHPIRDPSHPVAVASGHADHLPRGADGGPGKASLVAGVADRELLVLAPATVPDGGRAASQGAAGVLEGAHHRVRRVELVEGRHRVRLAPKQKVDVAVDEPRHHGRSGAVDRLAGKAVEITGRRHPHDAARLDEHRMPVEHPLAVEDPSPAVKSAHACSPLRFGAFSKPGAPSVSP